MRDHPAAGPYVGAGVESLSQTHRAKPRSREAASVRNHANMNTTRARNRVLSGPLKRFWDFLGHSGAVWELLGASKTVMELLGASGAVWELLEMF